MFCDFYNPSQGTYCKRLRVLCPEHFKDSTVISDTEVKISTYIKLYMNG
jgi:COMPASS component SPP1